MVAGGLGASRGLADAGGSARGVRTARRRRRGRGAEALRVRQRRARRDPQEEVRGAEAAEDAGGAASWSPRRRRSARCCPTVERDLRAAGLIDRLESADAEALSVDVELGRCPGRARTGADEERAVRAARPGLYREIVRRALAEDLGWGDVTTEATVAAGAAGDGRAPGQGARA